MYRRLYALFDGVTPLRDVDCGQLCDGICCRGNANEPVGMRLFPNETTDDDFTVIDTPDGGRLLTCTGHCDRAARPLACRVFPLFPYLSSDGRIRAVWDPRAYRLCPLVQANAPLNPTFVRAVRRAGRLLTATTEGRQFLLEQAAEIDLLASLIPHFHRQPPPRCGTRRLTRNHHL